MWMLVLLMLATTVHAQVTKMFVPAWASTLADNAPFTILKPYCAKVVPEASITNAHHLAGYTTGSSCSDVATFALYEDTDDTSATHLLASASGGPCGVIKSSSLLPAFSLTAGTPYRVCICSTVTPLSYGGIQQALSTEESTVSQLLQAFAPTNLGEAATSCAAGTAAPPPNTGPLTADTTSPIRLQRRIPLILVEQ